MCNERDLPCGGCTNLDCTECGIDYTRDPRVHNGGIGFSPNGEWCGECNAATCDGCKYAK